MLKLFLKPLLYTVKPAHVVTSIQGSPVLSTFSGSHEPKYSVNEPIL